MFNPPGFYKFFFPYDNVQTRFVSPYDIPILDINKRIVKLDPKTYASFTVIHISDLTKSQEVVQRVKRASKNPVIIVPDQNTPHNFEQIKQVYPEAMGKMVINGQDAHPLAKMLKKNCLNTYDFQMFGSKKVIPCGIFEKQGEIYNYYSGQRLEQRLSKLESTT